MTVIIVIALIAILGALASAGVFMLKRPKDGDAQTADKRMARPEFAALLRALFPA